MMPLDIHMVSWNRPKMTRLVINTINRNTKPGNYHLIVLDNGSDNASKLSLMELKNEGLIDELVMMDENIGLENARQLLLDKFTYGPYFICVDNDCLPPLADERDWIEKLYDLIQKYEGYTAIAARTQVMIGTGNIFEEADKVGDELVDFPHPGGSLRIMDTQAVMKVGGWDRGAPGRGSEERYICGKLREAGYKTAFATEVHCLHLFGTPDTDRWGYPSGWKPEDTGHSDIHHPTLIAGDDKELVKIYTGDTDDYRNYFG